jgi:hypothetical protein
MAYLARLNAVRGCKQSRPGDLVLALPVVVPVGMD